MDAELRRRGGRSECRVYGCVLQIETYEDVANQHTIIVVAGVKIRVPWFNQVPQGVIENIAARALAGRTLDCDRCRHQIDEVALGRAIKEKGRTDELPR